MYNLFLEDWVNVILPMLNFFVILFAFAAIETALELKQRNKLEVTVVEHIQWVPWLQKMWRRNVSIIWPQERRILLEMSFLR